MQSEPILIDEVAGPVVVEMNTFTGRGTIFVAGVPEHREDGWFHLPAKGGGRVRAKLRASILDPWPTVEVLGAKHRTGPKVPAALLVLAVFPFALVFVGGLLGGLLGGLAAAVNHGIARKPSSVAARAAQMVLVAALAAGAYLLVAGIVTAATDQPR
ncbi:hypothetical protein [Micromonospora siamensis]|uniref:Uncharacterized protein n=1 Tax=Micromonospora siamensis TaxID=299152 RepID=A0A1C5GRE3_9ACTN|nr:hypothetical protein [Micromonospora siamensis]SCG36365.1 hypothetical protein GA0074704_0360 [Micromonospora siamensis]